MTFTRRQTLGAGALLLTGAAAGCSVAAPIGVTVEPSIDGSVSTDGPTTVPVGVDLTLENRDSEYVGVSGLTVHAYDPVLNEVGNASLGAYSWRETSSSNRSKEESDGTTEYTATHTLTRDVEVDSVPEWITFTFDNLWFDRSGESNRPSAGSSEAGDRLDGLGLSILHYRGPRPPSGSPGSEYEEIISTKLSLEASEFGGPIYPEPVEPDKRLDSLEFTDLDDSVSTEKIRVPTVTATYGDGSRTNVAEYSRLETSDSSVAETGNDWGIIVTKDAGTVTVSASHRGMTARKRLTVTSDTPTP